MKLEYLLDLFKKFDSDDWNDLKYWSQSPIYILRKKCENSASTKNYLGTNGETLMMFDEIFKKKDLLESLNIEEFETELYNKISPFKKTYSFASFEKRIGELSNNYIEKFIGLKLITEGASELRWSLQTLRYLSTNKLLYHYDVLQAKIAKKNALENTALDLYNSYIFKKNNIGHSTLNNELQTIDEDLLDASDTLEKYFLMEIALVSASLLNINIIYNTDFKTINFKEKIRPEVLETNSLLKFIYEIYLLLEIIENESFKDCSSEIYDNVFQILNKLNKIDQLSSFVELKSCYFLLLTIVKAMIDNNYFNFSKLFFEIIESLNDKNLMLQRNNINIFLLKNIVEMSLQFDRKAKAKAYYFELTKTAILKKDTLPKEENNIIKKIKTFSFNQKTMLYIDSLFLFAEKRFVESYSILKYLKYTKQDRLDIDIDKLKIKLLFELEDIESLSKKLKSSKKKFDKKEINLPFYQKEKMLSFISILSSNQLIDKTALETTFKRKPFSAEDKKWLLEKYS